MLFKIQTAEDKKESLAEQIKRDIVATLKSKGIHISMVEIDVQEDNLNVSVAIREKDKR